MPPAAARPAVRWDVVSAPVVTGWSHGAGRYQSSRVLCAARGLSFDVWKLAKDARKLALYACGRGRADGLGGRHEELIGLTTSPRTTSKLRSTRDGSLASTLSRVCGLSTGHLGWAARPERAASAAMGRPELLLRWLAALRSRGGRRLARRATGECSVEPGQQVLGRCSSCGGLHSPHHTTPHHTTPQEPAPHAALPPTLPPTLGPRRPAMKSSRVCWRPGPSGFSQVHTPPPTVMCTSTQGVWQPSWLCVL